MLVLNPVQPGRPLFDLFARGIAAEFLRSPEPPPIAFEQLYGVMDSEAIAQRQLEFIKAKYRGQPIAAIIAARHPRYLQVRERLELSSDVPLIFIAERASQYQRPAHAVFIDLTNTLVDSYAFMSPMFAPGHPVAVLGGSAPTDRLRTSATLAALRQRLGARRVIDMTNLAIDEMAARVAALPANAVVVLDSTVADRTGRPISSQSVLASIKPSLRVPTVIGNDAMLGQGVLGGSLYRLEELGMHAGRAAMRVIGGVDPDSLPVQRLSSRPFVDARELARLGIAESRVPDGTTLLWRQPGLWEDYRGWILAGGSLLILQAVLIAGLLAERRRRLTSQQQLAERLRIQNLVADISSDFANVSGDRLESRIVRSLERLGHALGTEDCAIWALRWHNDRPRRVAGWPREAGGPGAGSMVEEALLTWARSRLEQGEEVHVDDLAGRPVREESDMPGTADASLMLLPLRVDGEVIGVLALRHAHSPDWSAHVLGDLRTIGEIIATAFVRKRTDLSMREQLETLAHVNRVASLGELAASFAHELNQPLAAILSNAEVAEQLLAQADPPLDELRAIVSDMIADDERAGGIIRNIRTMVRKHEVAVQPLDVNAVATAITHLAAHDARLRGGSLETELDAPLPTVTMDSTQLTQVMLNLVVNGVDATAGSRVRQPVLLRTRAVDGGVEITVRDHGPGIAPELLPRLFEPFFTTKPDGLGVGLAISRSILEAAGGRIRAENAQGGGARFVVWLPASHTRVHEIVSRTKANVASTA